MIIPRGQRPALSLFLDARPKNTFPSPALYAFIIDDSSGNYPSHHFCALFGQLFE